MTTPSSFLHGFVYTKSPKGRKAVWLKPDRLSAAERRSLTALSGGNPNKGTPFTPYDRLFPDWDNGAVFTHDWDDADMADMLRKSGRARQLEQVLTLPVRRADWRITGGSSRANALVTRNLSDKIGKLIDEMTSSVTYARSFHEITWTMQGGTALVDELGFRPARSCEAGFDPSSGKPLGFRQRTAFPGGYIPPAEGVNTLPGYVYIEKQRALVHTNGAYRDPVHGTSDMDVTHFWWQTAQKILFLWCQFLEHQSLPQTVLYGSDPGQARRNAEAFAEQLAGGVVGLELPGNNPQAKVFDIIENSGRGAEQFLEAMRFCNSEMVASGLAGFTELAAAATSGTGSYALSADQSEFFLSSRQAVADEMAETVREQLFRPLVAYNLGADVQVPKLEIGPLADDDTQRALDILKTLIVAPQLNVPQKFVDQLVLKTATYLGLDPDELEAALEEQAKAKAEQERMQAEAAAANPLGIAPKPETPGAQQRATPNPAAVAQRQKAKLAAAVQGAHSLVTAAQAGANPKKALAGMKAGAR